MDYRIDIIGMEENNGEIFIEEIMSSEESGEKPLHEVELGLKVESGKDNEELSNAVVYRIVARKIGSNLEWEIFRKYQDFQWLFKALKSRFPGKVLPYFPSPSVQNYLEHKAKTLNLKLRKQLFAPRQQELANFLSMVCGNRILGFAQEVQVFLLRGEEFQQRRGALGRLGPQSQPSSKSFSIYSFFSKGLSWLTSNGKQEKIQTSNDLLRIRYHLNEYSTQIAFLLQKFTQFVDLKITQMTWNGGSTQIDSVEVLKAKFLSSRSFGDHLINQIQARLIVPIVEEFKKEGQLQEQIGERVEAGRMTEYLQNVQEGSKRGQQLAAQIQQFDRTMLQEWPHQKQSWRQVVGQLDSRFRTIWLQYSIKMGRLWR